MVLSKDYPSFSVLMSVYKNDNPSYFDFALESIEQQTVVPNEIVLVEDGPISNNLEKIIQKHASKFNGEFKIVKLDANNGLGNALKIGTKYVSNKWFARMDADDYSVSNRFEKQLEKILDNPDLAVVGGQVKEFANNVNNIVGKRRVPMTQDKILKFIKWRSPFNHPTVMLNRDKVLNVGGYVPYGNLEDYYLWVRLIIHHYNVQNIDEYLVYMRVDSGMYDRRGNTKNIFYFIKLRNLLFKKGVIPLSQLLFGDVVVIINIFIPSKLRKIIYQNFLHKI